MVINESNISSHLYYKISLKLFHFYFHSIFLIMLTYSLDFTQFNLFIYKLTSSLDTFSMHRFFVGYCCSQNIVCIAVAKCVLK